MASRSGRVPNASKLVFAFAVLVISACGGGGGSSSPPPSNPPSNPAPPISTAEAFRFLNQATFGARAGDTQNVIDDGYESWIDSQLSASASLQLPYLRSLPRPAELQDLQDDRVDIWFRNVLHGDDQLRQRVAFALSEILVVSQISGLFASPYALADYYDLLANSAFGNYRDLLEAVTLHPAMGVYLSMLGNQKPNTTFNIRPDENYARELMQLFSIGLVQLNIDGSTKTDTGGDPVPTYDQAVIEGFAHVFTGWHWAGGANFFLAQQNDENQSQPMQLYPAFHDTGAKLLLNGVTIPAGQTGEQDLSDALDNIFNHDNVGPFVAYRLIQRLVTSNPSPAYIQRIAEVFNDNGSGTRGDLGAVVKAILLDTEARPSTPAETSGKIKEPVMRLIQLWRAYDARAQSDRYIFPVAQFVFAQGPLLAPSVFNFFSPFYAPAGEIQALGLVAPEMQVATEFRNTFITNYFFSQAFDLNSENPNLNPDDVFIDISEEMGLATDTDALVDRVAEKLLAGSMSATLRQETSGMINRIPVSDPKSRVAEAIYFIVSSPEFAYQR